MASFEIVKVVREHVPIEKSDVSTGTFGTVLDGIMHDMATGEGGEVQEITLHIDPSEWHEFCARTVGIPTVSNSKRK